MTFGALLRGTVVACAILAVVAAAIGSLIGQIGLGLGLAAGLLLGSMNGYLIRVLMSRGAPFAVASLFRIVAFSFIVLVAAVSLRGAAWTVALGVGLAQLVMVGVSVRAGVRS